MNSRKRQALLVIGAVMGVAIFAGWAGDGLKGDKIFDWLFVTCGWQYTDGWRIVLSLVFLALAFIAAWYGSRTIEDMFELDIKVDQGKNQRSARMLVFIVSPANGFSVTREGEEIIISKGGIKLALTGRLQEDIDNIAKANMFINWQQQMRGLMEHLRFEEVRLEKIVYVGSQDKDGGEDGSFRQIENIHLLLSQYLPAGTVYEKHCVNFLSFSKLRETLHEILAKACRDGFDDKDIVLDITGGTKTSSIAGADATLEGRVPFQYVDTGSPEVYVYQVVGKSKASSSI